MSFFFFFFFILNTWHNDFHLLFVFNVVDSSPNNQELETRVNNMGRGMKGAAGDGK